MKQNKASQRELNFVCPECGSEDGLRVEYVSWLEIEQVFADGRYDGSESDGHLETFSCGDCDYVLIDDEGHKVGEHDLAEWLISHCKQDDFESDQDE